MKQRMMNLLVFIEELKQMSENENTKKCTEYWKNVYVKWANERKQETNLEEYGCETLDKTLSISFTPSYERKRGGLRAGFAKRRALSQLFPPQNLLTFDAASACTSSHHVYNFSHCTVTLNIAADNSTSIKRSFDSE